MSNWKVRVSNNILTDVGLTHKAFYLYVNLKILAKGSKTIYIYKDELLSFLKWNTNKILKDYLKELRKKEIIDYNFDDFPINKPLKIELLIHEANDFTQVDANTIEKIKEYASNIKSIGKKKVKNTNIKEIVEQEHDLKEAAVRLFYVYEKYYNPAMGYARPTYSMIKEDINLGDKYIKIINTMFDEKDLVKVVIGKRHKQSSKRMNNQYIPFCDRKEENNE